MIALAHNAWATRELLHACRGLADQHWHQRFTLGAMLVHVTTHGMHHRAQCLNMLRHLAVPGVSDRLPEIDVLEWQIRTAEAFRDRGPMPSAGA